MEFEANVSIREMPELPLPREPPLRQRFRQANGKFRNRCLLLQPRIRMAFVKERHLDSCLRLRGRCRRPPLRPHVQNLPEKTNNFLPISSTNQIWRWFGFGFGYGGLLRNSSCYHYFYPVLFLLLLLLRF